MARFFLAVLLMLIALVQATFVPSLGFIGIVPDVALVFLLIWSATHGATEGFLWAFGLGLWLDLLTMEVLGTHAIALLAVAAIGAATRGRLFRSGMILPTAAVLVATLAYSVVVLLLTALGGDAVDALGTLRLAVMTSLLNALLVPVAWGLLLIVDRWMPRHVV